MNFRGGMLSALVLVLAGPTGARADGTVPLPPALQRWLGPQSWDRDVDQPVLSLGKAPAFDDMHLFAPCVALEEGRYSLWYPGSRGKVADRVFRLGLATSRDGRVFSKHPDSPVYQLPDGKRSLLTPALLRHPDGSVMREDGRLRLWVSVTDFHAADGRHTLHETTSADGLSWSDLSPVQLEGVYAPTVLREEDRYRLWYTDVSTNPWVIRHASSKDGRRWEVTPRPVLELGQGWESGRLFYPTVLKADGAYLMWYGSYWRQQKGKTALGFAVSADGITWHRSPHNPVFRPDPARAWESHYTTSQSVLRLTDGTWRIWYASRTGPPFVHKYYAIGTARWRGPEGPSRRP